MSDPDVEEICRRVPGWAGREVAFEPLEGGITNRNYLVTVDGERFVLRVPGADTDLLGIDRTNVYRAASAAAQAGVGPEVLAFLPEEGNVFVTRFVQGAHIPEEDLRRDDVLGAVVRSVRAFHGCAPIPSSFPVFRIVEDYARIAADRGVHVPPAYVDAEAVAAPIEAAFGRAPAPLTTCHDDLLNANFLRDGDHVWIVDYEYAGMGDPFFDLANLSVNNGLDAPAQELLLRRYFGTIDDRHRARLALMRLMSDFREAMWGVVQTSVSELDFDFPGYASKHFERLEAIASDPHFDDWLQEARR